MESANPRYTSGVSDEPKKTLQPIIDYANEPLLSLEEACKPLANIVPRLDHYIRLAKENSKNPPDDLTHDEAAAIRLYTMEWESLPGESRVSLYAQLNRTLKDDDREKLRPWFRYLKLFLTALAKIPPAPRQIVWRGVRKNQSEEYTPGEHITWWAFSSCTTSLSVLESDLYLGKEGTRTLFSIDAVNGRTIRSYSHFNTEDEILLFPGTYFEIKSRLNPAPDLYIVHLQQKIPSHTLLEPPFENAQLYPPLEKELFDISSFDMFGMDKARPWYKSKRFIASIICIILLIIFIILLSTLLATRKKTVEKIIDSNSNVSASFDKNISIYPAVSVAYAFYSFDGNLVDLHQNHDGHMVGGIESYTNGYVGTGQAVVLNNSSPSWIALNNSFNLTGSGITIEAFILLFSNSTNASFVNLSPGIRFDINTNVLECNINENITTRSRMPMVINQWYHVALVIDKTDLTVDLYLNSLLVAQSAYSSMINLTNDNVNVTIGYGFQGMIDQLSISTEAKTNDRIVWDASVLGYFPFDGVGTGYLFDYGPNGENATGSSTKIGKGIVRDAVYFNDSSSYFKVPGLTILDMRYTQFSAALWIRPDNHSGVFLTIGTSSVCLLVLGIRSDDNCIFAYLPNTTNATATNSISIVGASMTMNSWVHIVFTWSMENKAQLYKGTAFQGRGDIFKLNNGYQEPMTVSLGSNHNQTGCVVDVGFNITEPFMGAMDEFYIFSRELQQADIEKLNSTTNSAI